jgi:hypothetical protein
LSQAKSLSIEINASLESTHMSPKQTTITCSFTDNSSIPNFHVSSTAIATSRRRTRQHETWNLRYFLLHTSTNIKESENRFSTTNKQITRKPLTMDVNVIFTGTIQPLSARETLHVSPILTTIPQTCTPTPPPAKRPKPPPPRRRTRSKM